MTADADPVSGTLVFSTDSRTVVAEASERRDARGSAADREAAAVGSRPTLFDVPPLDEPKGPNGGELVN